MASRLLSIARFRGLPIHGPGGALSSRKSSVQSLLSAFKDPSSPYYLAPGTNGPKSPDELPLDAATASTASTDDSATATASHQPGLQEIDINVTGPAIVASRAEAKSKLIGHGYDPLSLWEQSVVWGDHDSFQHVNNVRYLRFLESGRIWWLKSLGEELGGEETARKMLNAKGVSVILKSVSINFKRPVTYPDTLLVGHRPHTLAPNPTQFGVEAVIYSYAQRAIVATSDCVLVYYDYDNLKRCEPSEDLKRVVARRVR